MNKFQSSRYINILKECQIPQRWALGQVQHDNSKQYLYTRVLEHERNELHSIKDSLSGLRMIFSIAGEWGEADFQATRSYLDSSEVENNVIEVGDHDIKVDMLHDSSIFLRHNAMSNCFVSPHCVRYILQYLLHLYSSFCMNYGRRQECFSCCTNWV